MRIGFILCEHPLDVRIKKEARSLASAGYEVIALLQESTSNQNIIDADAIEVTTYQPKEFCELDRALIYLRRMAFMRIPVEERIERFVVENKIDVIHVHDLPNVGPGIRVARRLGLPIVADLHENHPAAVRAWVPKMKWRHWITTNQTIWHSYQKRCVQRADQIIVVIEEGRDVMLGYGGVPADKVHVVANYVDLDYLREYSRGSGNSSAYGDKFVLTYIGGVGPDRGVDVAIRAMAKLCKDAPDALLVVVGDVSKETAQFGVHLRNLIKELGVEDSVELAGWQAFDKVPGYVAASSVGIVPHQRNPHRDNTIPNKLFDYMGLSKPVIVSDCPPLKRIVTDADAGFVFRADSPEELAERILRLYKDPELARRYGANGAAAVRSKYNWNATSAELVKVYELLGKK